MYSDELNAQKASTEKHIAELSKRESQVVDYIVTGMSNKRIARELNLTERTVKFHCTNIFRKLHIKNRASLAPLMGERIFRDSLENAA